MSPFVTLPSEKERDEIAQDAVRLLRQRTRHCKQTNMLKCNICAVCDELITVSNPCRMIALNTFESVLEKCKAEKCNLDAVYEKTNIAAHCTVVSCKRLERFALSPHTHVDEEGGRSNVLTCKECYDSLTENQRKKIVSPKKAMWRNLLVGGAPDELTCLTPIELSLVSANRIHTHAFVMHANVHDGICGYHSMFENRNEKTMGDIQCLLDAGLRGEILCVVCGPFDKIQFENIEQHFKVRPEKVITAFEWLKTNNHCYEKARMPNESEIIQPQIRKHNSLQVIFAALFLLPFDF